MSEWISCPKCGALMIGITAGHICPLCGYKVPAQTITTTTGTSAEYVPVIRCKDCKYNSNTEGNYVSCDIIPQMFGKTPNENYCLWAERKVNDDNS